MSRTIKIITITLLLVVSLGISFAAGCTLRINTSPTTDPSPEVMEEARSIIGSEVIEQAWNIISQEYVNQEKLDATALSRAAIKGMLEELDDPYTSYLDAAHYQRNIESLEGEYEGIGAHVGIRDEQLIIIAPFPGSPAAKAGIKSGDIILEADGNLTSKMSLEEAILQIRGPKGTSVKLLILHEGETEPQEIKIVRAEIELSSVYFEMREDIAYINISHFNENTKKELSPALKSITKEGATGIVLDLRRNPGGLLNSVVEVASFFLKDGIVLHVVDNQGEQTSHSVESVGVTTDLPMVILTDNYSASGSEVLAGAMQDHTRAKVAGGRTFGKGSVNTLHRLKDGSGLYITTARWLTPDGRLIEGEGISPDYEFELEGEDTIQWAIDYLKGNEKKK